MNTQKQADDERSAHTSYSTDELEAIARDERAQRAREQIEYLRDEAKWDALMQQREREEDEAVAEFKMMRDEVGANPPLILDRKFKQGDITRAYREFAELWLETYDGDFAFLVDLKTLDSLSTRQAIGVLNCWRTRVLRTRKAAQR